MHHSMTSDLVFRKLGIAEVKRRQADDVIWIQRDSRMVVVIDDIVRYFPRLDSLDPQLLEETGLADFEH